MRKLILLLILMLSGVLTIAQSNLEATIPVHLNVREQPGTSGSVVTTLAPQTRVIVEGRNEAGDWLFVRTADNTVRGWVAIGFVRFDQAVRILEDIPLTTQRAGAQAAPDAPPGEIPLPEESTDFPPVLLHLDSARAIYERGQALGNNPASFMKIGESNIAGTVFLCNLQWGNYDLGPYTEFQSIIDLFNSTESFCRYNVSAEPGFSSFSLFDPSLAPDTVCEPNETPLACEVRRNKPSYAFLYVGIGDMKFIEADEFRGNLVRIIRSLKDWGVVPILTTYPMSDDFRTGEPQEFNAVIREVGRSERIPLIDIRAQLAEYANRGTGPDGYHLSVPQEAFTSFAGNQDVYGRTLYEFLAMQVLYELHTAFNG